MTDIYKHIALAGFIFSLSILFGVKSEAHVMVAQSGTLNVMEDGVFMVLSLPVSAFEGIDYDKDGLLSNDEFIKHRSLIVAAIIDGVLLSDESGVLPLQGMMLSPVIHHESQSMSHNPLASQIVVMGRFPLTESSEELQFFINLFGKDKSEQLIKIAVTRKQDQQFQNFELTPTNNMPALFQSKNKALLNKRGNLAKR